MVDVNFGTVPLRKIILSMSFPMMLSELIRAVYNIVDSMFIGRYSTEGLTALSIIFPVQILISAFAVGIGVGINTAVAYYNGREERAMGFNAAGAVVPFAIVLWLVLGIGTGLILPFYSVISTASSVVRQEIISYGIITCFFSLPMFLEGGWTKVHQAHGNVKLPMFAQMAGAVINVLLDPVLIFGIGPFPVLGISGAAWATVAGQTVAAVIVFKGGFFPVPKWEILKRLIPFILKLGIPNILMFSACTLYILGLNLILATFSDAAVTVLGLYYKWQSFFLIPKQALLTSIVPILSYNFAAKNYARCKETITLTVIIGTIFMTIAVFCYQIFPGTMISFFTHDPQVIKLGIPGFRIIGTSFIPIILSILFPTFFQAVGAVGKSCFLTILRTIFLYVPLGFFLSKISLNAFWTIFPITEIIISIVGFIMYKKFMDKLN